MKRIVFTLLVCLYTCMTFSQSHTFEVRSFKALRLDVTSLVNVVYDNNKEACALIKVVGDPNYVFSSPLGIVQRREEVGEIWIYVPKGTRRITIKHPQWGVLRDYIFPDPLESRVTYELILASPISSNIVMERWLRVNTQLPSLAVQHESPAQLPVPVKKRMKRPKLPLSYSMMANIGFHKSIPSFGLSFTMMRRHGFYVRGLTNFRTVNTPYAANKEGVLTDGETKPYYTGVTRNSRHSVTIGGAHRISPSLSLYEGMGYGDRKQAWETTEKEWVRITDYSYRGLAYEAGMLWKRRYWTVSLGTLTIKAKYWEMVAGVGVNF